MSIKLSRAEASAIDQRTEMLQSDNRRMAAELAALRKQVETLREALLTVERFFTDPPDKIEEYSQRAAEMSEQMHNALLVVPIGSDPHRDAEIERAWHALSTTATDHPRDPTQRAGARTDETTIEPSPRSDRRRH